jgi:cytochrome c
MNDKNAPGYLANKVITGGGGVWGEHAMSAHPQLSKEEATEMVKYVLSVINEQKENVLPKKDSITLSEHIGTGEEGRYILTSSYTDNGNDVTPLTKKDMLVLRPAKVRVENADKTYNLEINDGFLTDIKQGSYFVLKNIDLKDIHHITYNIASKENGGNIAVHVGGLKGKLVSTIDYSPTGSYEKFSEVFAPVTDPGGKNDLYFVFSGSGRRLGIMDWVRFEGGKKVEEKGIEKKTPVKGKQKAAAVKSIEVSAAGGKQLMLQNDCQVCHSPDKKIIGPSYIDIAKRYKNKPSSINILADKIIKGGAGSWGNLPMVPHPDLSKQDASSIVKYILSLK